MTNMIIGVGKEYLKPFNCAPKMINMIISDGNEYLKPFNCAPKNDHYHY